ncbi:flavin reductase family protein [Hymenobacter crusticola]|uniref:Flavin reductase n=1 Tax=Hymenobacter crusticola TaxID=1770526 RepID=A0A243WB77_9BACT|nr:flavin reductase family protein [Hymenobacter crusticola]OUJ72832.1 flavin reductase [Hymenobacter crusticola]
MPLPPYRTITPGSLPANEWYQFMVTSVAPRPIAFVSTISAAGEVNLSPYSFFNVFSASPPILIFSATTRARDNSPKDTLLNVREVAECVINIANYPLVEQLSLTSTEYPRGVNEFAKAGFTEVASDKVRPPRAAECPAAYECVIEQIVPLGNTGGAGNLVICRVVQAHFHETLLNDNGIGLNPHKLEAVARLGGDYYCRVGPQSLLEVPRPNRHQGIGFDQLPAHVRHSDLLTGNNLGRLANVEAAALPSAADVQAFHHEPLVAYTLSKYHGDPAEQRRQLMLLVKQYLEEGLVQEAWKVLLLADK